jgi:hypothetical protein
MSINEESSSSAAIKSKSCGDKFKIAIKNADMHGVPVSLIYKN